MQKRSDAGFGGRERTRLRLARENGYLDARRPENQRMVRAYGMWCWRLKIPTVWFERQTRYSKYGRVHLEMFTTANRLTASGMAEMAYLGATPFSPHDACWSRVPLPRLDEVARTILRAAIRVGNYEPNRPKLVNIDIRRPSGLFQVAPPLAAS